MTSQLVDTLAAEVVDLRQANSELRRLLAAALQQRALPAPRESPEEMSQAATFSHPWWARWRWWLGGGITPTTALARCMIL